MKGKETYHTGLAKLRLQNIWNNANSARTLGGSQLRLVVFGLVRWDDESGSALHPGACQGIIHDSADE